MALSPSSQLIRNVRNLRTISNLKAAGADLTGGEDSSAVVSELIAKGNRIYLPEGTLACNVVLPEDFIIEGDGSNSSFIKPFDTAVAALTCRKNSYWKYHSQIRDLAFKGTGKVGVGFTFGRTNPNDYVAGDEYFNNVQFYNVEFTGLRKGFQAPAGNIGTTFEECGFVGNFYGAYLMDNRFGGDLMHAGNKYFRGGHMAGNDCCIYLVNQTVGLGGVELIGTIIETNKIGIYTNLSNVQFIPIQFKDVWWEANGQVPGASAETVTLDLWTGSIRSDQVVTKRTKIFDGQTGEYNFDGGFFTDINFAATEASIYCFNSRVEKAPAYGGGAIDVNTGLIVLDSVSSDGGLPIAPGVITTGIVKTTSVPIDNSGSNGARRAFLTSPRRAVHGNPTISGIAETFRSAVTLTGTFPNVGTPISDGQIFDRCNEYTASYNPGEYTGLTTASTTTAAAGWYVITADIKVPSVLKPRFAIWDRSASQVVSPTLCPNTAGWFTVAAIAYASGAGKTFYLDLGNPDTAGSITFRLSAYQAIRFDTQLEAQTYAESKAYSYVNVLRAAYSYDPPNLPDGDGVTTPGITVTGAKLGQAVDVALSIDCQSVIPHGFVSAADTVKVSFQNESGGAVNLGAATIQIWVWQE